MLINFDIIVMFFQIFNKHQLKPEFSQWKENPNPQKITMSSLREAREVRRVNITRLFGIEK